jgi:hypothetical protein
MKLKKKADFGAPRGLLAAKNTARPIEVAPELSRNA